MGKIKAGVIGATGYAGLELVRLLLNHPAVTLGAVSSVSFTGQRLDSVYPQLTGLCDLVLGEESDVIDACDVVFASLPAGLSEPLAQAAISAGKTFIDMGADFRLKNPADYTQWYGGKYTDLTLHENAVYCIPELHRAQITGRHPLLIGNPGCYPTSIALGLAPVAATNAVDLSTLVIDSKSGATGAGRGLTLNTHYPECNEAFAPYKIGSHRHTPEIEQVLGDLCGDNVTVTFTPHLLPINRGILSTMYVSFGDGWNLDNVRALYEHQYAHERFVQVLGAGEIANVKNVRHSNQCHISLHEDKRTNRLIVVSVIDNMVKGAAGQGIQNMNLALGIDEAAGLGLIPLAF